MAIYFAIRGTALKDFASPPLTTRRSPHGRSGEERNWMQILHASWGMVEGAAAVKRWQEKNTRNGNENMHCRRFDSTVAVPVAAVCRSIQSFHTYRSPVAPSLSRLRLGMQAEVDPFDDGGVGPAGRSSRPSEACSLPTSSGRLGDALSIERFRRGWLSNPVA